LTKKYKVGEIYNSKVYRIEKYGAFVKFDDVEGLLHISDVADKRIEKVEDELSLNDILKIEIKEIDDKGRIKVKRVKE
jgi:polyribonucleotide nucleotidyltransferase